MSSDTMASYHIDPARPVHRSFRLTRPAAPVATQSQLRPSLVLPEHEVRAVLAAASRRDVARGGHFSAGPAGVQLWSGPWDGPNGQHGSAQLLGSVDWCYDTPNRHYVTIYRVLLTAAGAAAGQSASAVLDRVLGLSGLQVELDLTGAPSAAVPPPRDPFRSINLRERTNNEQRLLS